MSDYVRANTDGTTHFADRDARSTGDSDKVVVGAHFDNEFEAILTAVNSKTDPADFATQSEAEGLTLDTKVITPHSLNDVLVDNAGIAKDLQALADPAANVLFGWNDTTNAAVVIVNDAAAGSGGITLTPGEIGLDLNDLDTETGIASGDFIAMVDITDSKSNKITFANLVAAVVGSGNGLASTSGVMSLDIDSLSADTPVVGDTLVFGDSAGADNKVTITNFITLLENNITLQEADISDLGTYLATGGTLATATFTGNLNIGSSGDIIKASHGNYLFHKSTAYDNDQNGEITFSTSSASGGTTGDIWFKYTA